MPAPRRVLLTPLAAANRAPGVCQAGHPIVWLLDGTEANGDGSLLGGCACSLRPENERQGKQASTPVLWRYTPPMALRSGRLTPFFPSMNRVAFALAMRLLDLHGTPRTTITDDVKTQVRRAAVAAGKARVRLEALEERIQQAQTRTTLPADGPEG